MASASRSRRASIEGGAMNGGILLAVQQATGVKPG